MKSEKRYTGWLLSSMLMLLMVLLAACSEESSNTDEPQGSPLQLSSVTRTSSSFTPDDISKIRMYVMTKTGQYSTGTFSGTTWTNTGVTVKEHEQYYMYGFMPEMEGYGSSISASSTDLNGDYSKGADLTLTGLPIFTSRDICAIVGVGRVSASNDNTEALEGNYGYLSGLKAENYVNLLMDHLYCKLKVNINVDDDYSLLRNIKLKNVKLTCTYGTNVSVTLKHRTGYGLQDNATIYSPTSSGSQVYELWTNNEGTLIPSKTDAKGPLLLGSVNCPPVVLDAAGTYMKITCDYDVYDKNENKLRTCTGVENKIKVISISHGMEYSVNLTVAPTYLYVLSDDDLNNPTIIVNN